MACKRERLIHLLRDKGIVVRGNSEEFDITMTNGIWVSAEEEENEFYFNYYGSHATYELGVHRNLDVYLEKRGWYAEWNDPGTIFLWEI